MRRRINPRVDFRGSVGEKTKKRKPKPKKPIIKNITVRTAIINEFGYQVGQKTRRKFVKE